MEFFPKALVARRIRRAHGPRTGRHRRATATASMPPKRRRPALHRLCRRSPRSRFAAAFTPAIEIGWRLARDVMGKRLRHAKPPAPWSPTRSDRSASRRWSSFTAEWNPPLAPGHGEDRHDRDDPAATSCIRRCRRDHKLAPHVLYRITRGSARPERGGAGPAATCGRYRLTATKRRSPSLLARRRSADFRPVVLELVDALRHVVGRRHALLRDLDDHVAGLDPLLGRGAAVGDVGHHDAGDLVLDAELGAERPATGRRASGRAGRLTTGGGGRRRRLVRAAAGRAPRRPSRPPRAGRA